MSGFVALYREATEHPLFARDVARFGAWCWLVTRACWKPTRFNIGGKIITLDRGQICASRAQLADAWGWSPSAVERFLTRLETEQMIGRATGQGRSIITICNYAKYQDVEGEAGQATGQVTGQPPDSHRTTKEQGNKGTIEDEEANASPSSTRARKKSDPFVRPDWVPEGPWDAFVAMRSRIKHPLTDHAKGLAIGELAKLAKDGHPPGDVLDQSTFRSWRGLFAIKDQEHGNGSGNRGQPPRNSPQRDRRDGFRSACDDWIDAGEAERSGAGRAGGSRQFALGGPDAL